MSDIMMQLGSFQFGLATAAHQEMSRTTEFIWAAQARFGQDDTLQDTGPGADNMTLTGVVYAEFRGGTGQLDALRALAAERKPQRLVDGRGRMRGEWVIEKVSEEASVFAQRGVARRQGFTVNLRRAPDSPPIVSTVLTAITAAAIPIPSLPNDALVVTAAASKGPANMLASLNGSLSTLRGMASQLGSQANTVLGAVRSGINAAKTLQNAGGDAARLLASAKNLANLPSAMNGLITVGGNVSRAADTAANLLGKAGINLQAGGSTPATFKAVQDAMISVNKLNVLAVNTRAEAQRVVARHALYEGTIIK